VTERLYYSDAYLTDFAAAVVARSEDGRRIYLDRTAFYPTSGGQPFDTGWLGDTAVTDVVDEGDRIAHVLAEPILGEHLHGRVDWPRRFDHMQQHTGQHLLSAILAERFGAPTVSVHFGTDASTLDLDTGSFSREQTVEAEARVNQAVTDNRPIRVSFEDAGSAAGLRKAPGRGGMLRIVTIEGLDRSACGGTHVRATGEIGPILIRKVERVKQLVRLEFVCGARAVRRALSPPPARTPSSWPHSPGRSRPERRSCRRCSRRSARNSRREPRHGASWRRPWPGTARASCTPRWRPTGGAGESRWSGRRTGRWNHCARSRRHTAACRAGFSWDSWSSPRRWCWLRRRTRAWTRERC
jgi:Ser-tRNA(Ala) deacylase AlaX